MGGRHPRKGEPGWKPRSGTHPRKGEVGWKPRASGPSSYKGEPDAIGRLIERLRSAGGSLFSGSSLSDAAQQHRRLRRRLLRFMERRLLPRERARALAHFLDAMTAAGGDPRIELLATARWELYKGSAKGGFLPWIDGPLSPYRDAHDDETYSAGCRVALATQMSLTEFAEAARAVECRTLARLAGRKAPLAPHRHDDSPWGWYASPLGTAWSPDPKTRAEWAVERQVREREAWFRMQVAWGRFEAAALRLDPSFNPQWAGDCRFVSQLDRDLPEYRRLELALRAYRNALRGQLSDAMRRAAFADFELNGRRCGICSATVEPDEAAHIDHIRPVAVGGDTDLANLRVVHARCNESSGGRLIGIGYMWRPPLRRPFVQRSR